MCVSSSLLTALRAVNFGSVSSIKTRSPIHNYSVLSLFDEALRQQSELSDWSCRCSNIVYAMGNKATPAQTTHLGINKKWMNKCVCVSSNCSHGREKLFSLQDVHRLWRRLVVCPKENPSICKFSLQHQELLLLATFVINVLINN